MTLLIACFAAIASTLIWYLNETARNMQIGTLCLMYWGASLMWLVDAVAEYLEVRAAFFTPEAADMLNEAYLGLSVVALGLVIWLCIVLVKDPCGTVHKVLQNKHE